MPDKIDKLYNDLSGYIKGIEDTFINPFIPADPAITANDYMYQVKAYCVLAHAAFEEYFEQVSLRVMTKSIENYIYHKKINESLLLLIGCYNEKIEIDTEEKNPESRTFDLVRKLFDILTVKHSKEINDNHGTSIKYLRNILIPVAIDILDDINTKNSLTQLSYERGTYAHKFSAKRIVPPEDAIQYVFDCLALSEDIRNKAKAKLI